MSKAYEVYALYKRLTEEQKEQRAKVRKVSRYRKKQARTFLGQCVCPACLEQMPGWDTDDQVLDYAMRIALSGRHVHHEDIVCAPLSDLLE